MYNCCCLHDICVAVAFNVPPILIRSRISSSWLKSHSVGRPVPLPGWWWGGWWIHHKLAPIVRKISEACKCLYSSNRKDGGAVAPEGGLKVSLPHLHIGVCIDVAFKIPPTPFRCRISSSWLRSQCAGRPVALEWWRGRWVDPSQVSSHSREVQWSM